MIKNRFFTLRYFFLIIVVCFVQVLVGAEKQIPFSVQYIQTGSSCGFSFDSVGVRICSSVNDLADFIPRNRMTDPNFVGGYFGDKLTRYNNDFFKKNFLVVLRMCEYSGSIRHRVESVGYNAEIKIMLIKPNVHTDDIAGWFIFIEMENRHRFSKYKIVVDTGNIDEFIEEYEE